MELDVIGLLKSSVELDISKYNDMLISENSSYKQEFLKGQISGAERILALLETYIQLYQNPR